MDGLFNGEFSKIWIKLIEQYPTIALLLIGSFTVIAVLWKDNMTLRTILLKELEEEKSKSHELCEMMNEVKKRHDKETN